MRLQYLESMYRAKQEDVAILSQYLGLSSTNGDNNSVILNGNLLESLSPESRAMLKNISSSPRFPSNLRMPTAFHFLPHLLDDPLSLKPAFLLSKGKQGVSVVLGIPTVKRDKQSYLLGTIENLITNMDEAEQNETIIVVFVGETDLEYVQIIAKQIEDRFSMYIENGLIEVLSPPASYYPNMDKLRITLNDPIERVKWRSKQNLDFSFLMAYAQPKGTFYVQLEDDILAKKGYITIMKKFAFEKTAKKDPWFVLDFCQLGFIGECML
jgi:alpha-1,3-mannosylglycoprotein beta-1,4-N-acetylglucosaminyltransferase A/B